MKTGPHLLPVAIIVQARMGASRLPGKPLKEVLGRSLLSYLIERLKRCKTTSLLCVATTNKPADEAIVNAALQEGVEVVRGSEEDVLSRYLKAADLLSAKTIVRITADCPLIDPELIDEVVTEFITHIPPLDYLSNTLERSYPRGMDVEIFSYSALEKAAKEAKSDTEREHVTPYIYRHPDLFRLKNRRSPQDYSKFRWTVDTPEDLELIKRMVEALYPDKHAFTWKDMLLAMDAHPDWIKLNQHVQQKSLD